ncbi:hypothetical protein F4802DRAFT_566069 [Xylaria palmicola]|nr:hypothetical protein F4802DRAFT_566069 [Xylaria palmicola]
MSFDFSSLSPAAQQAVLEGPALAPPPGVIPNFTNPSNLETLTYAVLGICLFLATVFILLRAYGRWYLVGTMSVGDCLTLLAYIFFVGQVAVFYHVTAGLGFHVTFVHQWDVQFKNLKAYIYYSFIGTNFYVLFICMIKSAILLEWLRIFSPPGDRTAFFWGCWATLVFNVVWWFQTLIVINAQCKPHTLIWDKTLTGSCIQQKLHDLVAAVFNLIMDLIIFALPQRVIWRLQLPFKKRFGLSLVFAIGVIACAAASGRLWYTVRYWETQDGTYEYSGLGLWSVAEGACGIMVATISTVPKTVSVSGFTRLLSTWTRGGSSGKRDKQKPPYHGHIRLSGGGQKKPGKHLYSELDTQRLFALDTFDTGNTRVEPEQQISAPAAAILRTTQVTTTYEEAAGDPNRGLDFQHPWMPPNNQDISLVGSQDERDISVKDTV